MRHVLFTLAVVAAAGIAMVWPATFSQVGGVKLTTLIIPLLQMTMFGMGATMGWRDFAAVATNPKGVVVGLLAQFLIMPLVGFGLSRAFAFEPEVAAGVVLIGCVPCGLASNVINYIAKANVPLSITLTATATLLGPLLTPVLMRFLGGTLVEVDVAAMTWDITKVVLIPIAVGLLINLLLGRRAWVLHRVTPPLSVAGIVIIVGIITAAGRDDLLKVGPALAVCVLLHNTIGFGLGYGMGRLCGLSVRDSRTVAIEVGMQNGGLAAGLAKEMGKAATMGLAPVLFATIMNVTGSILAAFWARSAEAAPETPGDATATNAPEPAVVEEVT
jgi:BASS family bile acid:Na+ symporter